MIILMNKIKRFFKSSYKYIVVAIITYSLLFINLPYVVYAPGGTVNLNDRVKVNNEYNNSGSYNMAYVSMLNGTIPFTLLSYIIPNWDLVKTTDVTYENESMAETIITDKLLYEESINNATLMAFKEAGKEVTIKNKENKVILIASYAETNLKVGDVLVSADNILIDNLDQYKTIIESHEFGDVIKLVVSRDNKSKNIDIVVKDDAGEKKTGISFVALYNIETSPKVEFEIAESESGPSGGLMLALSIYDKITKEDLSKGRKIVGTGTIDVEGNIGEIGGIKYKLLGAIKEKADIFLCPKANYQEAKKVLKAENSDILLIGVETLKEAISELS